MNKESLLQIAGKAESSNIEWKPSLSQLNEIIEAVAGFSNATAKRDLRIMVDKSILISQGNGPETYYVVSRYEPI